MTSSSVARFLREEIRLILPPTVYFFCAFNLIAFTTNLMVHHYWFALSNFMFASVMALIVGKVILVTHRLSFIDRFRDRPLIQPILFKAVFYSVVVALVRLLEMFLHIVRDERGVTVAYNAALDAFTWYHFTAVQLWLIVCFLIYVGATELLRALGKDQVLWLLFGRRSSPAKGKP